MRRWIVWHLPDLAACFIAFELGFPVILGGLTRGRG